MKNALETWTFRCLIFFCTVQSWKSGQVRYKKRSSYSFACQNRICWITVLNFSKYFHTQQHFEFSRLKSFQVLCRKTLGTTLSFFFKVANNVSTIFELNEWQNMEWQRQTRKCFEVTGFCAALLQLDHFSRSIILSRLGVDQSYTRNLPTRGGRRKNKESKKRPRFLAYLIKGITSTVFENLSKIISIFRKSVRSEIALF